MVVEAAKSGVSVLSLCEKGDSFIMTETGKIFKKEKEMKKGMSSVVFFPHLLSLLLTLHSHIHFLSLFSQVSLFLPVYQLTTVFAISLL